MNYEATDEKEKPLNACSKKNRVVVREKRKVGFRNMIIW